MMTIVIVDYGMGNLYSIKKMIDSLGINNLISNDPKIILNAEKLILPGVGSFHSAMQHLQQLDLIHILNEANHSKKPILGICLGMQLMAKKSSEGGNTEGLSWIDAEISRLETSSYCRIPHMGWNNVTLQKNSVLFRSFLKDPSFYFSHSYMMKYHKKDEILGTCEYGTIFPAVIQHENLFGTQFHPEKSQLNGKILMENFLQWKGY
jgi:glutamine amidotransferase